MQASRLTTADIIAARRELARRSLGDFACLVDIPTVPLTDEDDEDRFSVMKLDTLASHHALLCDKLQGVEDGSIPNLMVLMPPGSAKSTYTDVVFVPWFMSRKARRNVILASYASDIAKKQGRRARQLIGSKSFYNLTGLLLKDDQRAADEWALSNGSEYMSGGLLSGLTGNRGALGILDDPIKGRRDAESETIRNSTWDAYINDFCSRLIPGAPQVMILTRWHEDDPAGRILPEGWDGESGWFAGRDGRKWYVICLPAIADRKDDPLGRAIGETLWPQWFSLEHWAPFQKDRRAWTSLYQQKPTPEDGTFFKKEWFRRYRKAPENLHKYITSDHAPAGGDANDFTCARAWGVDDQGDLYLLDGFRHQETLDKSADKIVGNKVAASLGKVKDGEPVYEGLLKRHKPFCWFPEDDNNWKSAAGFIARMMREEKAHCRIEPISPHGNDKSVKAQAFQGMAASGRVWIPEGPEGDDVITQYIKFPGAKNDDEVDAAAIMGRALADAHPAIASREEPKQKRDRWDKAFGDDDETNNWKTA